MGCNESIYGTLTNIYMMQQYWLHWWQNKHKYNCIRKDKNSWDERQMKTQDIFYSRPHWSSRPSFVHIRKDESWTEFFLHLLTFNAPHTVGSFLYDVILERQYTAVKLELKNTQFSCGQKRILYIYMWYSSNECL